MELRDYFDELALTWDDLVTEETMGRIAGIIDRLDIRPRCRVLDVGSGTGILLPFLGSSMRDEGTIVAIDISAEMLRQGKHKAFTSIVDFAQADAMAIPLADASVDIAICYSVFPHFYDKVRALTEMARVLKENGALVICHTMSRAMINDLHQNIGGIVADHSLPDESELRKQAAQAGLRITHFEDRAEQYLVIAEKVRH
ncbi:MAG: class I SAM-dependent methyltransferase [Dehalococcoidia bacterium]